MASSWRTILIEARGTTVHRQNTLATHGSVFALRLGGGLNPAMREEIGHPYEITRVHSLGIDVEKVFDQTRRISHFDQMPIVVVNGKQSGVVETLAADC